MISIGLSGPVLSKITNKDLIDAGHSQKPIIKILLNRTKLGYRMNYNDEKVKGIHTSLERAKLIEQILIEHSDKNVVVSFNDKIHGYFMYNYLKNALPNIDMGIVHGDSKDRTEQIDDFKSGRITVLFASMILKRGANIPNIEVLIMGQGGKSVITVKQYLGRALRHDGKSDTVFVYDFYDVGQYIGKHSRDRVRIYKKEGFEVEQMYEHRRGFPVLK
jgi:superfamily II DNA or RNA helicase